jgi:hypothetical protein
LVDSEKVADMLFALGHSVVARSSRSCGGRWSHGPGTFSTDTHKGHESLHLRRGFTFQNYGDALPDGSSPTNLTAADVESMFGPSVCADAKPGGCDLIPEAQAWLDTTNQEMAGGHRFGFSVAAELLWQHKLSPDLYGASTTPGLAIGNNQALQRLLL